MSANPFRGAGLGAAMILVSLSTPAAALPYTFVSGTGNDANVCSRAAPCLTAHGAYTKTSAGGHIFVLEPGAYGALEINRSLTVTGVPGARLLYVIVNAGASDVVVLRGLHFQPPATSAIRMAAGGKLLIDDCFINANGVGAILVDSPVYSSTVVSNCRITHSNYGVKVIPNGAGAGVTLNVVQIDRSSDFGVYASGPAGVILNDSTVTLSNQALFAGGGATIYSMGNNAIVGNTTPGTAPVQVPLK